MKIMHLTSADRRKKRVRAVIHGSGDRPRISVFKSNKYFYAQAIDDSTHRTLAAITNLQPKSEEKGSKKETKKETSDKKPVEISRELGKMMADKLKSLKIEKAVLDRGPYAYKGNVHAFAEGLRENGIII